MTLLQSMLLGLVEGITEFLPISSTAHLIFTQTLLGLPTGEALKTFDIAIQLGAIAAVCVLFRKELGSLTLWKKLLVGFIPTGVIAFFLFSHIRALFDHIELIATVMLVGGVIMLLTELWYKREETEERVLATHTLSYKHVFILGCAQVLALIPGVSRSGAMIVGGLWLRLPRALITEFTFLIAVPTMLTATLYSLYNGGLSFIRSDHFMPLIVGFITAFFVSCAVISLFLSYIKKHSFIPFAIYRIIVGGIALFLVL